MSTTSMDVVDMDVVDMDVVDMDVVDMDMVDIDMVDMDMVDQRNVTQCNLSRSWIRWTTGHGHSGPRKQSISLVHYWVRHAKCTWSSFNLKARDASASKIFLNSCACPGSAKP